MIANLQQALTDSLSQPIQLINNPALLDAKTYRETYSQFQLEAAEKLKTWMTNALQLLRIDAPKISIVLGSGLGELVNDVEKKAILPFEELGLPVTSADGHAGQFILGTSQGKPILMQSGRLHCFENWHPAVVALPVRIQALAGIRTFILTNAAGGLAEDIQVGDVVLLTGHRGAYISPSNSLYDTKSFTGPFGEKFYPVNTVYDPELRASFVKLAEKNKISLRVGTYQFMPGPRYEEPCEIREMVRARKSALADNDAEGAVTTVGMSTAPEAYALAQLKTNPKFQDIKVIAISNVTNKAAGIGGSVPTSDEVIQAGPIGGKKISKLVLEFLSDGN